MILPVQLPFSVGFSPDGRCTGEVDSAGAWPVGGQAGVFGPARTGTGIDEGTATVDMIAAIAGLAAGASVGSGWWYGRARLAQAQVAGLRSRLVAACHAADHDALTGLPNRRAFLDRGSALTRDPARYPLVVVVVDLDDFKRVNDQWGHAAGDEVLMTVAHRLAAWAAHGLVARLGGDEFAGVWTVSATDDRALRRDADRLAQILAAPICVAGRTLTVTASIGLAPLQPPRDLLESLRIADLAMYRCKTTRRTNHPSVVDDEVRHLAASHTGRLSVRHEAAHHGRHSPAFAAGRQLLPQAETGGHPHASPGSRPRST
jgi:diguanylate cyclase (GGDEF)-like protein